MRVITQAHKEAVIMVATVFVMLERSSTPDIMEAQ